MAGDREAVRAHRHTSAVAMRIALTEATIAIDSYAQKIRAAHPGRSKGTVSAQGLRLVEMIEACAAICHGIRAAIHVEHADAVRLPGNPHDRATLETAVEQLVPGTYPTHRTLTQEPDPHA